MTKSELQYPAAMIFDMDGTLFQTEALIIPAYHATFEQLKAEGLYEGETPPVARMLQSLGMLLEQIWQNVVPGASREFIERADEVFLHYEIEGLRKGEGELYPGTLETLQALHKQGIQLFVASNGLELYVKEIVQHKGLAPYFTALYSAGEFKTRSKVDLVRMLLAQYPCDGEVWMVGDRSSDVEAGKANGLKVIGCDYARFGEGHELHGCDVKIQSFPDLLKLLPS